MSIIKIVLFWETNTNNNLKVRTLTNYLFYIQ